MFGLWPRKIGKTDYARGVEETTKFLSNNPPAEKIREWYNNAEMSLLIHPGDTYAFGVKDVIRKFVRTY